MLRGLAACFAVVIASATGASADMGPTLDDDTNLERFELEASLDARDGLKKSMGRHLTEKLTLWSNELGTHVNALTLDLVAMDFDVRARQAHIRIGTMTESGGLRLDGNIKVRSNVARISPRLALAIRGQKFEVDLPVFEVTSHDVGGERSVEVRLPIIYGRF